MKKILLPIDLNTEEREVIDEAVQLAKKFNSKIVLFNVDNSKTVIKDLTTGDFIDGEELFRRTQDSALMEKMEGAHKFTQVKIRDTGFLEKVKGMYEIEGINTEIIVEEGDDPASMILDEAEKGEYDLIIMKSHTLKKRSRFMLGSVTNKVVHHIKIPILVVR